MPSNAAGLGWASFVAGLGQGVPDILRQYNKDREAEDALALRKQNEDAVKKIIGGIPQYGASLEPEQAQKVWQQASRVDKAVAVQTLQARGALPQGFFPQQSEEMYAVPPTLPGAGVGKALKDLYAKPSQLPSVPDMSNVGGSALSALATAPVAAQGGEEAIPSGKFPYDNMALQDMIREKPQVKRMPKRVGYQDQERYLMENVKNPAQLASLKDYMGNISKLADRERDDKKIDREESGKEKEAYGKNVVELSKQALEVWKTKYNAANARHAANSKAKNEDRMYMKDLAGRMQQRLKDIGSWQLNFLKADEDQQELLKTQYPEFFSLKSKTSFGIPFVSGGTEQEPALDFNLVEKEVLRLRDQINAVERELAPRGGVGFNEPSSAKNKTPQDFFIKG